jgi:hypothetical protein
MKPKTWIQHVLSVVNAAIEAITNLNLSPALRVDQQSTVKYNHRNHLLNVHEGAASEAPNQYLPESQIQAVQTVFDEPLQIADSEIFDRTSHLYRSI